MPSDPIRSEEFFTCTTCGDCCKGFGGTYVSDRDIDAIAAYIGKDAETVIRDFCVRSGKKRVLAQRPDGYCVFWDKLCAIHPVKPAMCRNWPFIRSLKAEIGNWRIMAGSCPGINSDADPERLKKFIESVAVF